MGLGSWFSYGWLNPVQVGPRFYQYHGGGFLLFMALAFFFKPSAFAGEVTWAVMAAVAGIVLSSGVVKHIAGTSLSGAIALYAGLRYLGAGTMTVTALVPPLPPVIV